MSTGFGGDAKSKIRPRPQAISSTRGASIGEIPFFLDIAANPECDEAEERERAIAELESETKP